MNESTSPFATGHATRDDPAIQIRRENLEVLASCFKYKSNLAKLSSSNVVQLTQCCQPPGAKSHRPVGHRLARRIETGLGLPEFCMESPGGVVKYLPDIVARCTAAGIATSMPGQVSKDVGAAAKAPERVRPHLALNPPLKPLHAATLDSLESALRRGAISDKECLSLMQSWTPEQ